MRNFFLNVVSCRFLAILMLVSLYGCGGGYGESTNSASSDSREVAFRVLNGTEVTATPDPSTFDQALLAKGASDYELNCASSSCHGSDGRGASPLIKCGACIDFDTLVKRTYETMPKGLAYGSCDIECAKSTATYILAGFPKLNSVSSPTPSPIPTPRVSATPKPTPNISNKPNALIGNPSNDLIGLVDTAPFSATFTSLSKDDTGITRTQWYLGNVEKTQGTTYTDTFDVGRHSIKLVVTDQDSQTSETKVTLEVVNNGQAALACDPGKVFMAKRLWTPFFEKCIFCHKAGGDAGATGFVLVTDADNFYLSKSFDKVSEYVFSVKGNQLRDKAQGRGHFGGPVVPASQTGVYTDLAELFNRIITPPSSCPDP